MANENNDDVHQQQQQHQYNNKNNISGISDVDAETSNQHKRLTAGEAQMNVDSEMVGCARGTINDLVADLCLNGVGSAMSRGNNFGDYTNIRATVDTQPQAAPITTQTTTSSTSSFSFKHFLNSSGTVTAPSTTVTSLDAVVSVPGTSSTISTTTVSTSTTTNPVQTSTGARPKVPQSASITATSMSSLMGTQSQDAAASSKMKRSPRFSSFDSQASLAEYAGSSGGVEADSEFQCTDNMNDGGGCDDDDDDDSAVFRLYPTDGDFFPSIASNVSATNARYVPRSFSAYDMPPQTSNRRRRRVLFGINFNNNNKESNNKEMRPNHLAFNTSTTTTPKMKLDLPIESAAAINATCSSSNSARTLPNNAGDFPPAAAAALPDFVQDHWLDSWYAHDMHLNSPPNSPICDFGMDQLTGAASAAAAACDDAVGSGAVGGSVESVHGSKMLPDFLSDGPIIHSSQRLADVAVGLPSNSMGSPEDSSITAQLSCLRLENERLQRELCESRAALSEQMRRTNDLERQLQERPAQSEQQEQSQRRQAAATQLRDAKLRQQVTQLKAELESMRRDNDSLREVGAVGGSATNCDRTFAANVTATTSTPTASTSGAGASGVANAAAPGASNMSRPSRTQQFSRDLLLAASNAESNLRQLLAGVDNLRQMAADIENVDFRPAADIGYVDFRDADASADFFPDYIDESDDFEEFPEGPAL